MNEKDYWLTISNKNVEISNRWKEAKDKRWGNGDHIFREQNYNWQGQWTNVKHSSNYCHCDEEHIINAAKSLICH